MAHNNLAQDAFPAPRRQNSDSDLAAPAAGGPRPVPEVVVNRATVAELERRRILRLQSGALTILAGGAVIALLYFAKPVLIVVLLSVLLAFVLAPVVELLLKLHLPRAVGAMVAVGVLLGGLALISYVSYNRAVDFGHELPKYKSRIQRLANKLRTQAERFSRTTENVLPATKAEKHAIPVRQTNTWTDVVSQNAGSLSETALTITFIPFLVYFMLSWQDHVRRTSVMLFRIENRSSAYAMLGQISEMIRSFIVGNLILGFILSVASTIIFGFLRLPYFYFLGVISGFLSLIPYLGVILAAAPPVVAGLGHLTLAKLSIILLVVLGLHLAGMNIFYPKILGKRLQLNPLAVTLALLFWGWLWGAVGLILAVPMTGAVKIICDHIEPLHPYGAWLGE